MSFRGVPVLAFAATVALQPSAPATAASALRLPYPTEIGRIPGSTYDERGERVGDAHLVIERLESGNLRMVAQSGFDRGIRNVASAELAPIDDGSFLILLTEQSQTFMADGRSRDILLIDHREGIASCQSPEHKGGGVKTIELPADDRVANVPMNLLFRPLVQGEAESVSFQLFVCSGGPRLWDFKAKVARRSNGNGSRQVVEVRYYPDLGVLLSAFARFSMPRLSFWFDADDDGYLGHRLPLFTRGPNVMVVRDGVSLQELKEKH